MKKLFKTSILGMLIASFAMVSCSKDTTEDNPQATTPSIAISVVSVSDNSVTVEFNITNASAYNCAIGTEDQLSSFANGTLEGIQSEIPVSQKQITFDNLTAATEYTIFAQTIVNGFTSNSVRTLKVNTAEPSNPDLSVSLLSTGPREDILLFTLSYGNDAKTITYALGEAGDLEAFENGTLAGIQTADASKKQLSFSYLEPGKEYTLFVRANSNNAQGTTYTFTEKTIFINLKFEIERFPGGGGADITIIPEGEIASYFFLVNVAGATATDMMMFGSGAMDEIFVKGEDVNQPYYHRYTQDTVLYENCCIYYVINSTRNYSTNTMTYKFNVPFE